MAIPPSRAAEPAPKKRWLLRIMGGVVALAVFNLLFNGDEEWNDHPMVGGLVMSTPHTFSDKPSQLGALRPPGTKEVSMESRRCYVEAIAFAVPADSAFDLDSAMQGMIGTVAAKAGNAVSSQSISRQPILGLEAERCDLTVTRDGTTKPVTAVVLTTGAKVWGVIAVADKSDLDHLIGSLKFAPGAAPTVAAR